MSYVYIVLINYNGWEHTIECVESIINNNYKNFKIIIVDNNSNLGLELEKIFCERFSNEIEKVCVENEEILNIKTDKKFILIKNSSNNGFAAGCNCAFNYIRYQNNYKYIWLLGNDNVIHEEALNNLIKYMEKSENMGLCGSISLRYNQRNIIQCGGLGIYYPKEAYSRHLLDGENIENISKFNFDKIIKNNAFYLYVYGNSMFFSKDFFRLLNDIPEIYFIYFEELEIMQQLKSLNMNFGVVTNSYIYHKEGSSTGANSKKISYLAEYYYTRNRILFTKKYFKSYLPLLYLTFIREIITKIKNKQFKRILMILKLMYNPYPKFIEKK